MTDSMTQPHTPLPISDLPRLRKVLAHIDAHPDEWEQSRWAINIVNLDEFNDEAPRSAQRTACGTAFCIAGHTVHQEGLDLLWRSVGGGRGASQVMTADGPRYVSDTARDLLGLTQNEADTLFSGYNTRADVQRIAEQIAARAGEEL